MDVILTLEYIISIAAFWTFCRCLFLSFWIRHTRHWAWNLATSNISADLQSLHFPAFLAAGPASRVAAKKQQHQGMGRSAYRVTGNLKWEKGDEQVDVG